MKAISTIIRVFGFAGILAYRADLKVNCSDEVFPHFVLRLGICACAC